MITFSNVLALIMGGWAGLAATYALYVVFKLFVLLPRRGCVFLGFPFIGVFQMTSLTATTWLIVKNVPNQSDKAEGSDSNLVVSDVPGATTFDDCWVVGGFSRYKTHGALEELKSDIAVVLDCLIDGIECEMCSPPIVNNEDDVPSNQQDNGC